MLGRGTSRDERQGFGRDRMDLRVRGIYKICTYVKLSNKKMKEKEKEVIKREEWGTGDIALGRIIASLCVQRTA